MNVDIHEVTTVMLSRSDNNNDIGKYSTIDIVTTNTRGEVNKIVIFTQDQDVEIIGSL